MPVPASSPLPPNAFPQSTLPALDSLITKPSRLLVPSNVAEMGGGVPMGIVPLNLPVISTFPAPSNATPLPSE